MTSSNEKPYKLISNSPCDILFIECRPEELNKIGVNHFSDAIFLKYCDCDFRRVSMGCLPAVLVNGIDVNPTTEVIYAGEIDKALEYGGWPKLVLVLKSSRLRRTFKELSSQATLSEIESTRREFPTVLKQEDGSFWCTRLKQDDRRIGTAYEINHARWLPDDPWAALRAILFLGGPSDLVILEKSLG
jgi:hypothetical protein